MKTSEVFKQAKQYLWDGNRQTAYERSTSYICHAIDLASYASDWRKARWEAPYKRAKKIIHRRIDPCVDLEEWISDNVEGAYLTIYKTEGIQQMQSYRHRWLDALIQEFESKGE